MPPPSIENLINKATDPKQTEEDWNLIMTVCDFVNSGKYPKKDVAKNAMKPFFSKNPHTVMHSLTLLDALMNNCGADFRSELCIRTNIDAFRSAIDSMPARASDKLRKLIYKWTKEDFKNDRTIALIAALNVELEMTQGPPVKAAPLKSAMKKSKSGATSEKELDDLAQAIAASIIEEKEAKSKQNPSSSEVVQPIKTETKKSLYPTSEPSSVYPAPPPEARNRKVRAIYEFEAVESNELSFQAGDVIYISDDSDPNWWSGFLGGQSDKQGLFPAQFVTSDLNYEPAPEPKVKAKKTVRQESETSFQEDAVSAVAQPQINEETVDLCLEYLSNADPSGVRPDPPALESLENECRAMLPMLDRELEKVDTLHARQTEVQQNLLDAMGLYHQLMSQAPPAFQAPSFPQPSNVPQQPQNAVPPQSYQQSYAFQMPPPMMQPPPPTSSYMPQQESQPVPSYQQM